MPTKHIDDYTWSIIESRTVLATNVINRPVKEMDIMRLLIKFAHENIYLPEFYSLLPVKNLYLSIEKNLESIQFKYQFGFEKFNFTPSLIDIDIYRINDIKKSLHKISNQELPDNHKSEISNINNLLTSIQCCMRNIKTNKHDNISTDWELIKNLIMAAKMTLPRLKVAFNLYEGNENKSISDNISQPNSDSYKNLNNEQKKFYDLITPYPYLECFWDWKERTVRFPALNIALPSMNHKEQLLAHFFVSVWIGRNEGRFDILEAVRVLDNKERVMIMNWMANPFWP